MIQLNSRLLGYETFSLVSNYCGKFVDLRVRTNITVGILISSEYGCGIETPSGYNTFLSTNSISPQRVISIVTGNEHKLITTGRSVISLLLIHQVANCLDPLDYLHDKKVISLAVIHSHGKRLRSSKMEIHCSLYTHFVATVSNV